MSSEDPLGASPRETEPLLLDTNILANEEHWHGVGEGHSKKDKCGRQRAKSYVEILNIPQGI